MIAEADNQGGQVMYPTAFLAFLEVNRNLHVAMKQTGIHVQESEKINYYYYYCSKCTVNSYFHLFRRKCLPTNDFELTMPDLHHILIVLELCS